MSKERKFWRIKMSEVKHSDIVKVVEEALGSADFDIIDVASVEKWVLQSTDENLLPGKTLPPGKYGVVELRVIMPLKLN